VEELSSEDAVEFEERVKARQAKKAASNVPAASHSSAINCSRRSIHAHEILTCGLMLGIGFCRSPSDSFCCLKSEASGVCLLYIVEFVTSFMTDICLV
jgi:hypothetical protein